MDSSFAQGGVALLDGEQVVARSDFAGSEGHVALLPRRVDQLLAQSGWHPREVERIGVTLGPGSFSGARIALGLAKGLALAFGAPVFGWTTLEVVAAGAGCTGAVAAVLDARRGEVYAGIYEMRIGCDPVERLAPGVWEPGALVERLIAWQQEHGPEPLHLTGDGLAVWGERFLTLGDHPIKPVAPESWPLDVVQLGRMTARHAAAPRMPIEALEPVYVRKADAKEPADRMTGLS
ncbi:MAG: tRNA (adenosine(37)-N6)-threonylcarbamoyltransferase complex dimerization subunit type 1 TsaB [Magnetococcales bacterium]|nr:tRNA (adenosine(37)-N6)-threonylcarbamoyltransferase complex dimerization subunit type 1 TsaB [Magnetococcales bacterium]